MHPKNLPWNCPIPLRRSTFVPLRPSDKLFNVETDLSKVSSFHFSPKFVSGDELLYSDLQTCVHGNIPRRLGSGRSGFYRGKYLKGCGRTFLAMNWNEEDRYHNSGHMLASAAIREYLVTRYLEAKGAIHTIVPCEGLLLRPLTQEMKGYLQSIFIKQRRSSSSKYAKIDELFQGLTYKTAPSGFARASNFVWFLDHAARRPGPSHALDGVNFFSLLARFLDAPRRANPLALHPHQIARLYAESVERALEYQSVHFLKGVHWGSFHNNFTLDGRFLDLEVPMLFCGPFFGKTSRLVKKTISGADQGIFNCISFFQIASSLKIMTQYLKNRLTFLAENRLFADPQEGEYALEFLRCLEKEMDPRKHWLFQKREMTARLLKLIEDNIPLDARARKKVRDLLKNQWDLNFGSSFAELDICLRRVKRVGLIRSEGPVKVAWYVPEFMPDPGRHLPSLEEAIWVHQSLDRLDETRDLDQLMQGILDFEVKIRANCKP